MKVKVSALKMINSLVDSDYEANFVESELLNRIPIEGFVELKTENGSYIFDQDDIEV